MSRRAGIFVVVSCAISVFVVEFARGADDPKTAEPLPRNSASQDQPAFRASVHPLLTKYCTSCHGPSKPKGGLNLTALLDEGSAQSHSKTWERILEYVEGGLMPPDERPQPSREEVARLSRWVKSSRALVDCGRTFDPGRVTIRRLNRLEYNNTIRDLVGVDFHPADDFPSDDVGYGFDNIGDVLSLPPLLMEKYLAAAETISEMAIGAKPRPQSVKTWDAEALASVTNGSSRGEFGVVLTSESEITVNHAFPKNGDYLIRVHASGDQAGHEPVRMAVRIDGKELKRFDVTVQPGKSQDFPVRQKLRSGQRRLSVAFLNDYYNPSDPDPKRRDRNLIVESIDIEGPPPGPGDSLPDSRRRIMIRTPKSRGEVAEAAREIIQRFTTRAYRRPVNEAELAKLLKFVDLAMQNGDGFDRGIQLAVEASLVSPQFLFRVELGNPGPSAAGTTKGSANGGHLIGQFELASRLSYFLWSSMPDDELFRLAALDQLRSGDNLTRQVRRMLHDPKAQAFVESFAGQWLQLRNLKTFRPDKERFATFDEPLRGAMIRETELFFEAILRGDLSILTFLDADFTYVNERLARHYGLTGIKGDQFRRIKLKSRDRGGLLTHASILTVTSNPTRTSPVKRGKWVLEQILGTPAPPPPPDVPVLNEDQKVLTATSLRQRMEQHRATASCAACHSRLDPLGFGLENFDALGVWRDKDGTIPIDSSGTLPSGESFRGPKELKTILRAHAPEFTNCLTRKMLTYALGRGLDEYDRCAVDQIAGTLAANHYRFSTLVLGIVQSDPFQKRRD
jgi:Protein of unknown function (DUF1592)/Protein of unknown function (DUF1588)/Protein of unknown function (DUF1585)/Protein of unknown function (DUF1587)/Protein of unknown function (DUF1595)/Ca-dependent carbohydrate-binding module xylan-binding/Planctomycete cytochrome C